MKIAAIKCSAGLNLGNNFINYGGQAVLKKLYPEATIETFEFFDSCLPQWKSEEYLTPSTQEYIKNNFDIIFIFSGSAGGDTLYQRLYKQIDKLGVPFIPIGIGCEGSYNDSEKKAMQNILALDNCKKIITRDPKTFSFLENTKDCYSGIDLAFFAKDYLGECKENSSFKYAVVNYEPQGYLELNKAFEFKKYLEQYFPKVYMAENTVHPSRKDIEDYIQIGYGSDLWRFYANSSFNISTRIHTCVCSISNEVDFMYTGHHDTGGKKGRNTLFNAIDITLNAGEQYSSKQYTDKINTKKNEYIDNLKSFL